MHILWVTGNRIDISTYFIGRIELIKHLNSLGNNTRLAANWRIQKKDFGLKDEIMYLPRISLKILSSITYAISLNTYLFYYALFKKPDIVIMNSLHQAPFVFFLNILSKAGFIKTKFVLDIRSVPVETGGLRKFIDEVKYKYSVKYSKFFFNGITVITPLLKQKICEEFRIDRKKVGIWSSGVSLNIFNSKNLHKVNIPSALKNKFILMYHGALSKSRGLQETVKAIKILNNRYPNIAFFMLGEGKAKSELELLIKQLNLENNIILRKSVPYNDVPKYIASCDIGILPFPSLSWWRVSCPLKLMEYLAMEKAVIVTDIEAHRSVIGTFPCGIFIKSSEPEEIAKGIEKAYNLRGKIKEVGKVGREIVRHKYTWKKQAENLLNFLKNL